MISATLNFFLSSPSLSSFIKQLKKTLENSIKFYKSKISDSPQTKEYYQNLVKIFHAYSLWIDETRLHDSNLYLPALPSHYKPDLLGKIFHNHCNPWYEYINLIKVNESLLEHVKQHQHSRRRHTSNKMKYFLTVTTTTGK